MQTAQLPRIRGWLFTGEEEELRRLAAGKTVLEVGSYCGKSTVTMAQVANRVIAVDDFRGAKKHDRADSSGHMPSEDTREAIRGEFFDNLEAYGVRHKVTPMVGSWESVLPHVSLSGIDMVFYDADHSYESTYAGGRYLMERLPPSVTVAFHDYAMSDPGVIRAVDALARDSNRKFRVVNTLAVFDPAESPIVAKPKQKRIFVAFPGKSFIFGAVKGVWQATTFHDIKIRNQGTGWDDFNMIWAEILNEYESGSIDYAAMLHSDIAPEPGWLDILVGELERLNADFISAPAPIKDRRGVTSSGIGDPNDRWQPLRRWTVREICEFPETWNAADAGYPGGILLHNTGCWVANLANPLFRQVDEDGNLEAFFDFPRRMFRDADGKWITRVESEDWYFSRKLHKLGANSYVTRKVRLIHQGVAEFPNNEPWGTYQNGDEDTAAKWRK